MPRLPLDQVFADSDQPAHGLFIDHMHPSVLGAWVMSAAIAQTLHGQPELLGLGPEHTRPGWRPPPPPQVRTVAPPKLPPLQGGHPPHPPGPR